MRHPCDILGEAGLRFFGQISASISHELKNVLSIINENAGLLEDLALMAETQGGLDPTRVQLTTRRIQEQVKRADAVIRNLNCFSHSVDSPLRSVDLHPFLQCLVALTRRLSDMRGVKVVHGPSGPAITLVSSPFFLKVLLWHLLDLSMGMVDERKTVLLQAAGSNGAHGVEIRFSQLATSALDGNGFHDEAQAALIDALDAQVAFHPGDIVLALPTGGLDDT
jgi:signal transduction histidine kinase